MTSTTEVAAVLEKVVDVARVTEPRDDDEARELLAAVETADQELRSLAARLRIVVTGGEDCGEPPDLAGSCPRCGGVIAQPVAAHKPGCNPFKLAHRAVRLARWTRLTIRTLQSSATAPSPGLRGGSEAGGCSAPTESAPGTTSKAGE